MQATGRRVSIVAELTARVQLSHHELNAAEPRLLVDVHRYPAPVIIHFDGIVIVQRDGDVFAVSCQRFVDRVVDNLPETVH